MSVEPEGMTSWAQPYENSEPESICIKEEPLSDCDLGDEASPGRSKKREKPTSFGMAFCVLCLRECTSDVLVRFSAQSKRNHVDVTEGQRKLEQVLGLSMALDDGVVCRTCWKLVDIVGDFRESCLKSASWIERFSRGMQYEAEIDSWLSRDVFNSMEAMHKGIQDNRNRIELEEVIAMNPPEIKVARKGRKKPVVKMKTEVQMEGLSDDVDVSDSESSSKATLNPAVALLGDDNHNPSILACEKCGRKIDGITAHRMHVERCVNAKKPNYHTCTICNATFKELSGLRFHMNKHNGVRPFKCRKFCDRTFFSNFVRIKHERGICEVDGRICSTCGAHLKNEFSLKKHIERVHGEAKHVCATCGKAFRSSLSLRTHQRVHSDERKYPCKICEKAYKSPYAVKVHMRIHTQEKPYACHLCEQVFNYKVSMKSHIERHHGQTG
ncbi:zinc finger protein 62-like [Ochlerotatus camptorhynchus]|uniref:zinc finger protein 62-like n=1 Tax=Ochlerotatus camptorhynchus TaxID=644619 RepID=UPI0031D02C5B